MTIIERQSLFKWGVPILYLTNLIITIVAAMGYLFPYSQLEIINLHPSLMQPTTITFLIWILVYGWTGVSVFMEFVRPDRDLLLGTYRSYVRPLLFQALLFNLLWTISWCNNWILVSLVAVAYYARTMIRIMQLISFDPHLRLSPMLLKYPMGLHAGWVIVSSIAIIDTLMLNQGIVTDSYLYVIIVAILLIAVIGVTAYYFAQYGNELLMIPAIWFLIGVVAQQLGKSSLYAQIIFWLAVVLTVIGLGIYIHFLRLKQEQDRK
ncbi:hypothetical protein [Fundicoccus culcitae]|uniref:Tryptophan-rich sensory protein n=1 Tax=Fundicoccus culcitae TaxID=2969821 RepID=A0ABY5P3J7_9LACT|nr:hypothetical protein [Fundicoccus culcitae]UUX33033.1 hypothetical protein NRE15_08930 [Fundicoccus culcitae]